MIEDRGVDVQPLEPGQRLAGGFLFGAGCPGGFGRQEDDRFPVAGLGEGAERGQPHGRGRGFRRPSEGRAAPFRPDTSPGGRELDPGRLGQLVHEIGDLADLARSEIVRDQARAGA